MMTENNDSIQLALKETTIESKKIKVKQLIANGADLSERNEHLETPLHVAISKGLENVATELIPRMSVKMLNTFCSFGLTPLYLAIEKNQYKTAQLLLRNGASVHVSSFVGNKHRVTSLQLALQFKNYKMIKLLLEYEPQVSSLETSELLELPLHWVVKQDCRDIAKLMFKSGNAAETFSKDDFQELFTLAKSPEMGEILLKQFYGQYIQINIKKAFLFNMLGIIEYFVKNDPNIINDVGNDGCTYLHFAVSRDMPQVVELLIKLGFDVNAKSNHNETPLHFAVMDCNLTIVEILLEHGANIDAQQFSEDTPLMVAIHYNNITMAKFLIEKGGSLTMRNIDKRTPMEIALKDQKMNIAFMILFESNE